MSTPAYGAWRIDGPPPIPQRYGLVQAGEAAAAGVRIITDVDAGQVERWLNGAEVFPYPAVGTFVFDACAPASEAVEKPEGEEVNHPMYGPITVGFAETCTSYSIGNQDEFKARAVLALTAVESSLVAAELMNGDVMMLNPHFTDGNGDFPFGNTPTSPINGLARLEASIAASGRLGLIHVPPSVATFLYSVQSIYENRGVLQTINGIPVIADFGYESGDAPYGHAAPSAQEAWLFATGPIDLRRSEIFVIPGDVTEALDRVANSITYRAERYYLADWDTQVQAAVLVDRCATAC